MLPNLQFNRVIVFLTGSDIFSWGLLSSLNGLIGIYLAEKFGDSAIEYVGIGYAITNIMRALLQIPIGVLSDKLKSQNDEVFFLALGNTLIGAPFLLFPLISEPYHYFFLQFIIGIGMACNLISWRKLFATNLDRGKEGLEYGIYDTIMSIAGAFLGVIAGVIASLGDSYFDAIVIGFGALMIGANVFVYLIYVEKQKAKKRKVVRMQND